MDCRRCGSALTAGARFWSRRYLAAMARRAPLVLIVEDLHWADDGVLAYLDFLARWGEGPTLILGSGRHELFEQHPSWGAASSPTSSSPAALLYADGHPRRATRGSPRTG